MQWIDKTEQDIEGWQADIRNTRDDLLELYADLVQALIRG